DESYVRNLLRCFGEIGETGLRIAAVTRHPELVPTGVKALPLETRVQELRMAWAPPRRGAGAHPVRAAASRVMPRRGHDSRPLVRARRRADGPEGSLRLPACR